MSGAPDPAYVLARRALLDGLEALRPHLDSLVVVGAQAVYVHTGRAELAVAEFTTDADLVIGPEFLAAEPAIRDLLESHGFELQGEPGKWRTPDGIQVDLMVPEALAGAGRRGARLGAHGKRVARRAKGLEGALVDFGVRTVEALEDSDAREFSVAVAGPSALFVAKVHKIAERVGQPGRLSEKDALDVLRLLRAVDLDAFDSGFRKLLASDIAQDVTNEAIALARGLFADRMSVGCQMAARAAGELEDAEVIAASLAVLVSDLVERVDDDRPAP